MYMHKVKSKGRKRMNQKAFDTILAAGRKKVVIMKKEWKLATPPGAHLLRKYLKKEYKVQTIEGDIGWVIRQI